MKGTKPILPPTSPRGAAPGPFQQLRPRAPGPLRPCHTRAPRQDARTEPRRPCVARPVIQIPFTPAEYRTPSLPGAGHTPAPTGCELPAIRPASFTHAPHRPPADPVARSSRLPSHSHLRPSPCPARPGPGRPPRPPRPRAPPHTLGCFCARYRTPRRVLAPRRVIDLTVAHLASSAQLAAHQLRRRKPSPVATAADRAPARCRRRSTAMAHRAVGPNPPPFLGTSTRDL